MCLSREITKFFANFAARINFMRIYKTWSDNLDDRQLKSVVDELQQGALMVWPTDTLYAVACSALYVKAIERLCRLKNINPEKTNLSIVCADISQAARYARIDNRVFSMLKQNTPGPFTFLFRTASTLPRAFKGRKVVGVRIPALELNRQIAAALDAPILTTSVEFDSQDYFINPSLIAEEAENHVDFMIDNGYGGTEPSTIVDCTGADYEIVRQGKGELQWDYVYTAVKK